MSDYDDYENNLFFEPIGDMSKLNDCNDGKRSVDVLVSAVDKCKDLEEKLARSEKMRDLQAEYACKLERKLKIIDDVISDVEMWFSGMVETLNNECAEHNKSVPVGNFEQVFRAYANSLSDLRKRIKE